MKKITAPVIKNGDMEAYARDLGMFLMVAKLTISQKLEEAGIDAQEALDEINHVEQELKAWGE